MNKKTSEISPQQALARLQKICGMREKCVYDLRRKLAEYGIAQVDADKIIASLQAAQFVDDSRFAFAYVREKHNIAKWGRRKIAQQLSAKRISTDIATEALAQIEDDDYAQTMAAEIEKKRKNVKYKNVSDLRAKLLRFAVSRGYEYSLAYDIIKKIAGNNNDYDSD